MNERILTEGRFIRNALLPERQRTLLESLESKSEHDKSVELVAKDTACAEGHIYDEIIGDSCKGKQHIRLIRTTKPYNPDFIVSAQTLAFLLPDIDYSKRIVTPKDGDRKSWQRFMEINKICAEVIIGYYKKRGMENFSLLIGGSFNPYTDADILRTQSVKAAHVHTLLISEAYLQETVPFCSIEDFKNFLSKGVLSPYEIKMDYRRFFRTPINDFFNLVVSRILVKKINKKNYSSFASCTFGETPARFPISGIKFVANGLDFLSSDDFIDLIKTVGENMEEIYKDDLMPLFVQNYEEATNAPSPESIRLNYNNVCTALYLFDQKVEKLRRLGLTNEDIDKAKKLVKRLALHLSNLKSLKFNLGPAYSFSVLYDVSTNKSEIFFSYNPFGGGTFDAMGLDKVWFPNEERSYMEQRFKEPKSVDIEEDLFKKIQEALSQNT